MYFLIEGKLWHPDRNFPLITAQTCVPRAKLEATIAGFLRRGDVEWVEIREVSEGVYLKFFRPEESYDGRAGVPNIR